MEVRILNGAHVAVAFGEPVAAMVHQVVAKRIERFLNGNSRSPASGGEGRDTGESAAVEIADGWLLRVNTAPAASSPQMEDLLRALALEAIVVGEQCIHIAPSVSVCNEQGLSTEPGGDQALSAIASDAPFAGEPVTHDTGWAERYRNDMRVAARLLADLKAGDLSLAFQPIRMALRKDKQLYEECLLRLPQEAGLPRGPGLDIMALERLGLIRVLDCHIMWLAIEQLRVEPERRLGVNISAQSACLDGWWAALSAALEAEHELAERITIEITETSGFPSMSAAIAFAQRLRQLGCRIALDDFGAGRDAIRNLYALQPDIVKIDAFFVRQARRSSRGQAALKALVGFARAIGGTVVAEGVETKADCDAAAQAGAAWQQGFFIDPPQHAGVEPGTEVSVHETRGAFGRRPVPPALAYVVEMPPAASAVDARVVSLPPRFELRWLQWAISLGVLFWALIAGTAWLGWGGSS
ncbi:MULTISPECIES: EAL domain-containing protein [unclassified Ensifer]|uniref:EAL domain-containing protein n=1 Tax=unclassified Ensifer TaxID=2633371 RepID=UPI00300FB33D